MMASPSGSLGQWRMGETGFGANPGAGFATDAVQCVGDVHDLGIVFVQIIEIVDFIRVQDICAIH